VRERKREREREERPATLAVRFTGFAITARKVVCKVVCKALQPVRQKQEHVRLHSAKQ